MNRDELEKRNVGENLDTLMNLDPRGYGVCRILYAGSRKATGEPLTMHAAQTLVDAVKPGDLVYILTGFVLLPHKVPEMDGMEALRRMKESAQTREVPVIFLTAKSSEVDKVRGLDLGAEDYITKPFGTEELLARIRAVLRSHRHSKEEERSPGGKFRLQDLLIDYDTRQVFVGKEEIDLTQTEYNIMAFLSVHAGKVLTYAAIIRAVWGYSDYGSVKKLQVNMKNIRKKMGVTPGEKRYIINELGVGYRMLAEDEA